MDNQTAALAALGVETFELTDRRGHPHTYVVHYHDPLSAMGLCLAATKAGAVLAASPPEKRGRRNFLITPDPYLTFARALSLFYPETPCWPGLSPRALVGKHCRIAKDVNGFGLADKINHKSLILPGHVAVLSGELEEELPGWDILVGPREAVDLPAYLKMRTTA